MSVQRSAGSAMRAADEAGSSEHQPGATRSVRSVGTRTSSHDSRVRSAPTTKT